MIDLLLVAMFQFVAGGASQPGPGPGPGTEFTQRADPAPETPAAQTDPTATPAAPATPADPMAGTPAIPATPADPTAAAPSAGIETSETAAIEGTTEATEPVQEAEAERPRRERVCRNDASTGSRMRARRGC